jgi:thiol-disulfide isomerase/thioredoxin
MSLALAASLLLLAAPQGSSAKPPKLELGMPAPTLSVEKWIKGAPVAAFEKDKVYVVEFWATWCPPCIASMPHLSSLQRQFGERGVTIVGLTSADSRGNTLEKVERMVSEKGDGMGYTVAWDKGRSTYTAFMDAAGQNGIPTSFVIDKAGRVAYIGHPMFLDEPLGEILAGTWDVARDPAELEADQAELFGFYGSVQTDPKGTLAKLPAFETRHPHLATLTDPLRLQGELATGNQGAAGVTGARIAERAIAARDAEQLNALARLIAGSTSGDAPRDLDLALRAAQKAAELTGSREFAVLETLANVHFLRGELESAVAVQTKAVTVAPDKRKAGLMRTLEEYQAKSKS